MFIAQPMHCVGHLICEELLLRQSGHLRWRNAEFAVAWANNAGVNKIFSPLRDFVLAGCRVRVTVGLDFGHTTYEGLSRLLELEPGADMQTYVFFDENPACTFHPKVFLFSNDDETRLMVGSNNMTGAGLESNVEATLSISAALADETVVGAFTALAMWRDEQNDSRIRRLTQGLLEELKDRRYVLTEEEVRARRRVDDGIRAGTANPLFGRSSIRPVRPGSRTPGPLRPPGRTTGSALGEVLLMRVRPRRNGNQVQISMKILEASFMNGVEEVVSVQGARRRIGYNLARGIRNTARFEAPEMSTMQNPVARFQWVNVRHTGPGRGRERVLQYEIFDAANDPQGLTILRKLESGIADPPLTNLDELSQEETVLSITNLNSAQWYRLDSV
ncbi:phospholipase D family protein [Herbaspirillum sp. C9C3]|uniref:phospholipase D-like domain-containing protein n=1 Tax=Herbaspirillum sp. C9C3 TaxID=2735271 RepID=UPI0015846C36|nr:phospholipase D family protein [Herbaspirillum sp. C9C3]NUT62723.1 hypothetical protein [Herbaspirillum sp. C9C3]